MNFELPSRNTNLAILTFLVCGLASPTPARALKYKLRLPYTAPAPAEVLSSGVEVAVVDDRPTYEGRGDSTLVGRSTAPITTRYVLKDVTLDGLFTDLTTDALRSAGIDALPAADGGGPEVRVTVTRFWSEGYLYNDVFLAGVVELIPADSDTPRWSMDIDYADTAGTLVGPRAQLERTLTSVMDDLVRKMGEAFAGEDFRAALSGPVPPVADPAQPIVSTGCGKDVDCKGDRICSAGVCVDP